MTGRDGEPRSAWDVAMVDMSKIGEAVEDVRRKLLDALLPAVEGLGRDVSGLLAAMRGEADDGRPRG